MMTLHDAYRIFWNSGAKQTPLATLFVEHDVYKHSTDAMIARNHTIMALMYKTYTYTHKNSETFRQISNCSYS
jgi:hypothetical protein